MDVIPLMGNGPERANPQTKSGFLVVMGWKGGGGDLSWGKGFFWGWNVLHLEVMVVQL